MKKDLSPKYLSSSSYAKKHTIAIDSNLDPRLNSLTSNFKIARQNAEISIIGLNKSPQSFLLTMQNTGVFTPENLKPNDPSSELTYPGVFGAILNPDPNDPSSRPTIIVPTDPQSVTATWVGDDLQIDFDWDPTASVNIGITQFIVKLTADGVTQNTPPNTFKPDRTQSHQTLLLTKATNTQMFNIFNPRVTAVCVETADPLNNVSNTICAATAPSYVLNLPVPEITVTSINNGYKVAYTKPTSSSYDALDIWEIESNDSSQPSITYASDGITPTNYTRVYFGTINPAIVTSPNTNKRWVIARFSSSGGVYTAFCTGVSVTPYSPVSVDLTPPDEIGSVSASWSGDDIQLSYSGVSTGTVRLQAELTSSNSIVGYFYFFPDISGSHKISSNDLFLQFGEHYNSFSGILRSIDAADNRSSGVSFNVPVRSNPLSSLTATQVASYFTLTGSANSYVVNISLPSYAKYAHVYDKTSSWSSDPTDETYLVTSGSGSLVVPVTNTTDTHYIKIRFYDDFGYTSAYSNEKTVSAYDPGQTSLISNPIKISTDGTIFAGDSNTSYPRVYFNKDGIFAYDAGGNQTTEIINSATNGQPTFITTRAQIADWAVSDYTIENTLSPISSNYTGLSGSGTYAFWAGSPSSGGSSTAEFYVKSDGTVKANNISITGGSLQIGSGFSVAASTGKLTASGADITGKITASSGSITGNLSIGSSGSVYSGNLDPATSNGQGFILNQNGLRFNSSSTNSITTIDATTGKLITKSANIGGWDITSSQIYKASGNGNGNIYLDSTDGSMYVTATGVSSYTAGIVGPQSNASSNVFWAGSGGKNSTSNDFRVTLDGHLYANKADIKGSIATTGSLGTVTLDGNNDKISFTGTQNAYIMPRNNNMFYTSVFSSDPFSGTDIGIAKTSAAWQTIFNAPMLSIGNLTNAYGNTFSGIGLYTGGMSPTGYIDAATYGGASKTAYSMELPTNPWISLTTNGVQVAANQSIGIRLEPNSGYNPGITLYSAVVTDPTKGIMPDFTAGAIKIQNDGSTGGQVKIYGGSGGYAIFNSSGIGMYTALDGSLNGDTSKPYMGLNSSTITVQANSSRTRTTSKLTEYTGGSSVNDGFDSAYHGASKITIATTGVSLSGAPFIGDMNVNSSYTGTKGTFVGLSADYMKYYDSFYNGNGNGYLDIPGLGPLPRSRALVEDPSTGVMKLGFAIYYQDTSISAILPTGTSGYVGDLWVQY